ncbi:MAG: 2-C-methyl-D-erythritol 2,4-cyclodiphosphate synthase, partial [Clostridiales bacterium]|nr:2-C-methyl-D-erythritol 2,4-cyclodiphosphate synthase [Clostridiales bacterium]
MTIGQDSHRFEEGTVEGFNTIMLGGCPVPFDRKISANSDGDVILHAITNAISGYTGINILGGKADELCLAQGVTDSRVFLNEALSDLGN